MAEFDVDLFVIGGGSGGVRAARIAAGYGARVMVAEEYRMGGTCVIRGCVPKKLFVIGSHIHHEIEDAAGFGWSIPVRHLRLADAGRQQGQGDRAARRHLYLQRRKVRRAHRQDPRGSRGCPHASSRQRSKRSRAKHILIATGSTPNHGAAIPGIEHVISSDEAFHLPELPKRIVIQGGGYIALEFACIFAGFGSDVTVIYRGDNILRGFDEDVRVHVRAEMEKQGITILTGCTVNGIDRHRQRIHDTSVEWIEHRLRPGDVRDRTASERRQYGSREGRRRHQSEEWRHRGRRLVEDVGAEYLRDRRRHPSRQPHAGRDPRRPRLCRYGVRQAAGRRSITRTFRPRCFPSPKSARSA